MANIKSAAKRALQSEKRHAKNLSVLTKLKTAQKKVRTAISAGKSDEAKSELKNLSSALDKAAKRGIIHKNSADRRKSSLAKALKPKA